MSAAATLPGIAQASPDSNREQAIEDRLAQLEQATAALRAELAAERAARERGAWRKRGNSHSRPIPNE